jgi:hypothetical protein
MPFGFVFVFVFEHHEDYERTFVHSDHSHLWDLRDGLERRLRRRPYSLAWLPMALPVGEK